MVLATAARVRCVPRCWCTGWLWMGRMWGSVQSERGAVARFWERESNVHIRSWWLVLVGWEWHVSTARTGATRLLRHAHAGDMDTTHQWQHIRSPSCKRVRQHCPRPDSQHSIMALAFATVGCSVYIRCVCIRPFQRHGRLPILQLHRANTAHLGTDSRALPIARLLGTYTVTPRPTHQQQLQHPLHL